MYINVQRTDKCIFTHKIDANIYLSMPLLYILTQQECRLYAVFCAAVRTILANAYFNLLEDDQGAV